MTPTDHPSEEDLSALLDGERGASAHVRRCAQCRSRVDQLRSASLAVAAPVALPDAAARDAAIARAVAVAGAPARLSRSRERWTVRFRRPLLAGGAALTAAAAVVAFVVARPHTETTSQLALKRKGSASGATSTSGGLAFTAGAANGRAASAPALSAAPGTGAPPQSPGLATDLGDVPDGAALRARVGPAVRRSGTSEQRTAAASGGASGGTPTPAAAPQRDASASAADVPPPYAGPPPPCEAAARSVGPAKDRLIYAAAAKWQGRTPAVVLAFVPEPPAAGPVRVYVMEQGSCRVLFSDSYDQ